MLNRYRVIGVGLIAILVLAVAPTVFGAFTPEVFVIDQPTIDNIVNVTRATVDEPGWVVIHADADGAPGPVIGYSALPAGINANVKVTIDPKAATGGSRVTYAIDDEERQTGRLFHYDEFAEEDIGIHVGSLLGATLIGMKVDTRVPFLQADGTFRRVHLLTVERNQA